VEAEITAGEQALIMNIETINIGIFSLIPLL